MQKIDHFRSTTGNQEKIVMNEVQADFFRKESGYSDMNITNSDIKFEKLAYGGTLYGAPDDSIPEKVEPPASSEVKARKPVKFAKRIQVKGVGFNLLYSNDSESSQEDAVVRKFNVETPCKILMAVVLIAYFSSLNLRTTEQLEFCSKTIRQYAEIVAPHFQSLKNLFLSRNFQIRPSLTESTKPALAPTTGKKKILGKFDNWLPNLGWTLRQKIVSNGSAEKCNLKNENLLSRFEKIKSFVRQKIEGAKR